MSDELDGLWAEDGEKGSDWISQVKKKPYLFSMGLLGLFLLGVGVLSAVLIANKSVESSGVEILEAGDLEEIREIMVDVAGAVKSPGVYRLKSDARVNEAVAAAGGFIEEADQGWVSKNLNLAAKLSDGQKLYIPEVRETNKDSSNLKEESSTGLIDINSASVSELDTLWGVGEATAKKIIEGRPYSKVEELLSRKMVNSNVYEEIKDEVSVY